MNNDTVEGNWKQLCLWALSPLTSRPVKPCRSPVSTLKVPANPLRKPQNNNNKKGDYHE